MIALLKAATTHPGATESLEVIWAYITLAASGIVTEEATPLIGGLAAHDERLMFGAVVLSIALGTWIAGIGLYYIGRLHGDWARQRFPRLRAFMIGPLKIVRRHPWRSSLAVRWAYGLRLTLPIACGAARISLGIYLIGSAISCLTWSFLFTLLGWAFGRTMLIILGHVRRYESKLVAVIIVGIAIAFWLMRKRHVEDEVVEVLAKGDTGPIPKMSHPDD